MHTQYTRSHEDINKASDLADVIHKKLGIENFIEDPEHTSIITDIVYKIAFLNRNLEIANATPNEVDALTDALKVLNLHFSSDRSRLVLTTLDTFYASLKKMHTPIVTYHAVLTLLEWIASGKLLKDHLSCAEFIEKNVTGFNKVNAIINAFPQISKNAFDIEEVIDQFGFLIDPSTQPKNFSPDDLSYTVNLILKVPKNEQQEFIFLLKKYLLTGIPSQTILLTPENISLLLNHVDSVELLDFLKNDPIGNFKKLNDFNLHKYSDFAKLFTLYPEEDINLIEVALDAINIMPTQFAVIASRLDAKRKKATDPNEIEKLGELYYKLAENMYASNFPDYFHIFSLLLTAANDSKNFASEINLLLKYLCVRLLTGQSKIFMAPDDDLYNVIFVKHKDEFINHLRRNYSQLLLSCISYVYLEAQPQQRKEITKLLKTIPLTIQDAFISVFGGEETLWKTSFKNLFIKSNIEMEFFEQCLTFSLEKNTYNARLINFLQKKLSISPIPYLYTLISENRWQVAALFINHFEYFTEEELHACLFSALERSNSSNSSSSSSSMTLDTAKITFIDNLLKKYRTQQPKTSIDAETLLNVLINQKKWSEAVHWLNWVDVNTANQNTMQVCFCKALVFTEGALQSAIKDKFKNSKQIVFDISNIKDFKKTLEIILNFADNGDSFDRNFVKKFLKKYEGSFQFLRDNFLYELINKKKWIEANQWINEVKGMSEDVLNGCLIKLVSCKQEKLIKRFQEEWQEIKISIINACIEIADDKFTQPQWCAIFIFGLQQEAKDNKNSLNAINMCAKLAKLLEVATTPLQGISIYCTEETRLQQIAKISFTREELKLLTEREQPFRPLYDKLRTVQFAPMALQRIRECSQETDLLYILKRKNYKQ